MGNNGDGICPVLAPLVVGPELEGLIWEAERCHSLVVGVLADAEVRITAVEEVDGDVRNRIALSPVQVLHRDGDVLVRNGEGFRKGIGNGINL